MKDKITGKCHKCGKGLALCKDGACKICGAELCWECWKENKSVCPVCNDKGEI